MGIDPEVLELHLSFTQVKLGSGVFQRQGVFCFSSQFSTKTVDQFAYFTMLNIPKF